jgi:hypothetical protein
MTRATAEAIARANRRGWVHASQRLPEPEQTVYYFGSMIGLYVGRFDPTVETQCWVQNEAGEDVLEAMPPDIAAKINHNKFRNNNWGVVDTDDAPWWMLYDAERAKSWCPLPPDYIFPDDRLIRQESENGQAARN